MKDLPSPLPVTVVVVNYNGRHFLDECLSSIKGQTHPPEKVIVVDNASTDGSVPWIEEQHPWVTIVESGENAGYCEGNNIGIRESHTPFVVLLNNDTRVHTEWLKYLYEALAEDDTVAACSSLVILPGETDLIHYAGSSAHFMGHIANLHYLRPLEAEIENLEKMETGVYVGSSVILRKAALDEVGLLEEKMFIYEDEFDMSIRLRSRGWRILFEPRSRVWHYAGTPDLAVRSRRRYPPRRAYLVSRNRWMVLLRLYQLSTLVLLFPMLVLFECAWCAAMIFSGTFLEYWKGIFWNWRERRWVAEERRRFQQSRSIPDYKLLTADPLSPVPGMATSGLGRAVRIAGEIFLRLYWDVTKKVLTYIYTGRRT